MGGLELGRHGRLVANKLNAHRLAWDGEGVLVACTHHAPSSVTPLYVRCAVTAASRDANTTVAVPIERPDLHKLASFTPADEMCQRVVVDGRAFEVPKLGKQLLPRVTGAAAHLHAKP